MHAPTTFATISGVAPGLATVADSKTVRTEAGIGALMPWAGRLWLVTYLSNRIESGSGTGLYSIDDNFQLAKHPESVAGCYANRMVHGPSHQIIIGPHIIDADGVVRTIPRLSEWRLTAAMEHLFNPKERVYLLSMEGKFWELNVHTLESKLIADLAEVLGITPGVMPHFKGGYTAQGRVVVANNTYREKDFLGDSAEGRLAEWDGRDWTILERSPYCDVAGRRNEGETIFASGWDRASAVVSMCIGGEWRRFRFPKASHTYDHYWQSEWPRIREVEHERLLMDLHGMFYELQPYSFALHNWGIVPIGRHLRVTPDYCSWRGLFVMAGNQATQTRDTNILAGEPQAGLWFGKTDDLWQLGKPQGWGGPYWDTPVREGEPSDPYLMTGFDAKSLHLSVGEGKSAAFRIEVDFKGIGEWYTYEVIRVRGYAHHEFPSGFGAHWVRLVPEEDCTATAQFTYL